MEIKREVTVNIYSLGIESIFNLVQNSHSRIMHFNICLIFFDKINPFFKEKYKSVTEISYLLIGKS